MILRKKRAFTLIELLVVIIVIMILATFVSISLVGTKKRSRDEKRISDANNIAAALDQYALDHVRQFPVPTLAGGTDLSSYTIVPKVDLDSSFLASKLSSYLSPFPKDPLSNTGGYGYDYVVSNKGLNAAIIVREAEITGAGTVCNMTLPLTSYPASVQYYLGKPPAGLTGDPCYYVAK